MTNLKRVAAVVALWAAMLGPSIAQAPTAPIVIKFSHVVAAVRLIPQRGIES